MRTTVHAGGATLEAELDVPPSPRGVVVFAHGSGSSRHSPRNGAVARQLRAAGLATVLLDLLTADEDRHNVFDVALLAGRLAETVRQVHQWSATASLPVGLFGAGTGTAAALQAATDRDLHIAAIVSRGGRPDLAWDSLAEVVVPTLLVVGGADHFVVEVSRRAEARLRGPKRLVVLPGAGHLFEEPGALSVVAEVAASWYARYLGGVPAAEGTRQGG
ncbi:dienelactone hydrolase family protein [Paractinoplanes hotanensis]|uniref:Lysophospholipase n=1 Tax=Paractinoplanes hotanensis TaxID=2906497 RepID=A0ABT0Y5E3_9ACTN|nr:alpha/beta fold hydrolase [Actinoplanes hotanensis]MCM4081263.1 lysophospholipase [Actinoplanes hotanensis]